MRTWTGDGGWGLVPDAGSTERNIKPRRQRRSWAKYLSLALLLVFPMLAAGVDSRPLRAAGGNVGESALIGSAQEGNCRQSVDGQQLLGSYLVGVSELHLRSGPSLDCEILSILPFGAEVDVVGSETVADGFTWAPVQTAAGRGFVYTGSLRPASEFGWPTKIPVLMYHDIGDPPNRYRVAPWQLEEQLSWLRDNGYVSITPSDLLRALDEGAPLPERPVILSIDDGWASSRIFTDLVRAYGFKGTYMLPNFAELTAAEIVNRAETGEICGHSVSHQFLADLSWDAQYYEVAENKLWLEGIIGKPVICFSYPFGSFTDVTTQVVQDAGYRLAFHAWWGPAPLDETLDRWHIQRIEVSGEYALGTFIEIIGHYAP